MFAVNGVGKTSKIILNLKHCMKQSNSKTSCQNPSNFGMDNGGKEPINVAFRNVAF
jgi:hypothetical protein